MEIMFQSPIGTNKTQNVTPEQAKKLAFQSPIGTNKT
jgi:hypothetical protein